MRLLTGGSARPSLKAVNEKPVGSRFEAEYLWVPWIARYERRIPVAVALAASDDQRKRKACACESRSLR